MASDEKKAERKSAARTMRRVAPYLWPEGETWVKRRVVLSLPQFLLAELNGSRIVDSITNNTVVDCQKGGIVINGHTGNLITPACTAGDAQAPHAQMQNCQETACKRHAEQHLVEAGR